MKTLKKDNLNSGKKADEKLEKSAYKPVIGTFAENQENVNDKNIGETADVSGSSPAGEHAETKRDAEEKKAIRSLIISYSVCFVIAAGVCLWVILAKGVFSMTNKRTIFATLSDGFFVPGVLLLGFGIMFKIAAGGFLDGVSFGLRRAFLSLIPGGRLKKEENYGEYKERKAKARKKAKGWSPVITGLVFTLVAVVFLILYSVS